MSKYIIELEDDIKYLIINGRADNRCYTLVRPVAELEELNSDYINEHFGELQDEAYQRGYDEGYKKCLSENDFDQPCVSCDDYHAGMDKAWQLAEDVIYNRGNVLDILHCATVGAAFDKYSAGQALDILRAYKKKKIEKDRIEVGDEVQTPRGKAIVTAVKDDFVHYFYSDGDIGCFELDDVTKTGKHYDIQSILEAMRNDR